MGAPRTTHKVLDALKERVDQPVTITTLMTLTGQERHQVQSAILSLKKHGMYIDVVTSGSAWIYREHSEVRAEENNGKRLFDEIGVDKNGRVVIQDENGKLYLAAEL